MIALDKVCGAMFPADYYSSPQFGFQQVRCSHLRGYCIVASHMIPETDPANKIEVYTDGQCNLCRWMRARVEPLDRDQRLEWMDYNQPEILKRAAPHTREEMAEKMHVRPPDGHWYKGYFAWIEITRVLPRWKWLAPVMGVWPFTRLGPIFYHWLASRRYSLFGAPPPCDESGVCQLHK